jgi:hypothetical protein
MTYENSENEMASYSKEFTIKNTGAALLNLNGMILENSSPGYLIEVYLYNSMFGYWEWTNIEWLGSWPAVFPDEELKMKITHNPTVLGTISENLIVSSSLGETIIPLTGSVILPPTLSVNTGNIKSEVSNLTDTDSKIASIDNEAGQSPLNYSLTIDYNRVVATSIATSETMATLASPSMLPGVNAASKVASPLSTQTVFNRILAHENATVPSSFLGYQGQYDFRVATRFNAGNEGFNVTHIQAFYRAPEVEEGTVEYEVRAGGSEIANAKILSQGTYTYTYTGDDAGEWIEIPLANSATVYPNEDFYIIINYPMELENPQGYIENTEDAPGRYHYFYEGKWYDLQEAESEGVKVFEGFAFMMRAAEETFASNSWVSIHGKTEGAIAAGASLDIQLDFKAAYGDRGDQFATLVIHTNDPVNPTGEIPMTFHINAGPQFIEVPALVRVNEGVTKVITLKVKDVEDHHFTITPKQTYAGVTHSLAGEFLTITLAPGFESAGTFVYEFLGKDDLGAESSMTLNVEVLNTNRAPKFIGENESMTFNATGLLNAYRIKDFFSDPDGDEFTFSLANSNSSSVTTFASENEFLIRPIAVGEAILIFTVTDSHSAVKKDTLEVKVDIVLGAEEEMANNGLGVYPNPAIDQATVTVTNDWSGEVTFTLLDVSGKKYLTQQLDTMNAREIKIDVSKLTKGIYILRAVSNTKQATIKLIKK